MRQGFNPNKDQLLQPSKYKHQVIIPVYIPHFDDYFKDSLSILKLCIASLLRTSHDTTYITIVNSGSHAEVKAYLDTCLEEGKIHELIHTANIGKLNAIVKGLTGNKFPLVTISDADVLFLNDWQKATYEVFRAFPKAGFVSPTPSSRVLKKFTYNIIVQHLFSSKLRFTKVKNESALRSFAKSIGNPNFYNQHHLETYLTIAAGTNTAVVGGGHFVGTYRGLIFDKLPYLYSEYSLGGTSENDLLDRPIVDQSYWRLSTEDNYAYHLGNVEEAWMSETLEGLSAEKVDIQFDVGPKIKSNKLMNKIQYVIFTKILLRKPIWRWFLKFKGLNKEAIDTY